MKKIFMLLVCGLMLVGCSYTKEDVEDYNKQYEELDARYKALAHRYADLSVEYNTRKGEIDALKSGRSPRYFVLIQMYATKYTDPQVWVETTRDAYNSVNIGDEINHSTYPFTAAIKHGWIKDKQVR